jgi:hypothetical protein
VVAGGRGGLGARGSQPTRPHRQRRQDTQDRTTRPADRRHQTPKTERRSACCGCLRRRGVDSCPWIQVPHRSPVDVPGTPRQLGVLALRLGRGADRAYRSTQGCWDVAGATAVSPGVGASAGSASGQAGEEAASTATPTIVAKIAIIAAGISHGRRVGAIPAGRCGRRRAMMIASTTRAPQAPVRSASAPPPGHGRLERLGGPGRTARLLRRAVRRKAGRGRAVRGHRLAACPRDGTGSSWRLRRRDRSARPAGSPARRTAHAVSTRRDSRRIAGASRCPWWVSRSTTGGHSRIRDQDLVCSLDLGEQSRSHDAGPRQMPGLPGTILVGVRPRDGVR